MSSLAVVILTKNEEIHLARALDCLHKAGLANEVYIIDSYSTDKTQEIAEERGANFIQHEYTNQAQQLQWALDSIQMKSDWVMRLDADEVLGEDLCRAISEYLTNAPEDVRGINLQRRHIFMGRWIRYGGRYPLNLLRVWRKGEARVQNRWMDEHIVLQGGKIVTLKGRFEDRNLNDIGYFIEKHNSYANREAVSVLLEKYSLGEPDSLDAYKTSRQAMLKAWLKKRIYNRIPFQLSSTLYFVWRYFFQLGFLDGIEGLAYHFLQGYWYRFLVGVRLRELEVGLAGSSDKEQQVKNLAHLSGLAIE
ncbi:glycosyltransferase family 2 protein [Rhodococcus koreensis]|uniref:glycosyltransferase family 2 protein n=1 Tax=Rhodococcus koreensis TaxID=99653 RepID=UPI00366D2775